MKAAWFALAVATLALVAWIALRPAIAPLAADDGAAIRAALERIELTQARQAERLARLEGRVAPGGMAPEAVRGTGPSAARGNVSARNNGVPLDPVHAAARQQAQLRTLEDRLVSEPLSAGWATAQERAVGAFLSPANLAREGLPAPKSRDTRCQSRMCRIRLAYPDEDTALAAQAALLQSIAPSLPHARSFMVPRADGGIDLVVFAGGDDQAVR